MAYIILIICSLCCSSILNRPGKVQLVVAPAASVTSRAALRTKVSCLRCTPSVSHSSIFYIHIDVNESRHIYLPRFININMNIVNARMTYIVKRRK